jgi:hypothetical protein
MRHVTFLLVALMFAITALCQKEIKLDQLNLHVGDRVTVRGKIFGIRYLQQAKNTPTFIN